MKRLNMKVLLLSSCVSIVLLFGGWFIYQYAAVDKPLNEWLEAQDGLEVVDLVVNQDTIHVQVLFQDPLQFVATYHQLQNRLQQIYQERTIVIRTVPEQSEWNEWWGVHAAPIFEAIHHKRYTQIEEILAKWYADESISAYRFSMNLDEILIYLQPPNEEEIYVILPLNGLDVTARIGR
jgi:hypothetical protein